MSILQTNREDQIVGAREVFLRGVGIVETMIYHPHALGCAPDGPAITFTGGARRMRRRARHRVDRGGVGGA